MLFLIYGIKASTWTNVTAHVRFFGFNLIDRLPANYFWKQAIDKSITLAIGLKG